MAWLGFWGCLALAFVIWKTLKFKKKLCSLSRKNVPWNFNQFLTKSIGVYVKSTAEKFRLFTDTLLKDNCNYFLLWKNNDCANFEPINRKTLEKPKATSTNRLKFFAALYITPGHSKSFSRGKMDSSCNGENSMEIKKRDRQKMTGMRDAHLIAIRESDENFLKFSPPTAASKNCS